MSEDTPAPAPEPPPEPPAAPAPVEPAEPEARPQRKPRRRGRTTLLIATAAVLGVLAGAGTGYRIQQERPETPLPPLAQPKLIQPAGAAAPTAPLTAADDHLVKVDGDLRKLLVERPKGTKEPETGEGWDGWVSIADYAADFHEPDEMFQNLSSNEFRRAAGISWSSAKDTRTDVLLLQFRDEQVTYADDLFQGQGPYMRQDKYAGNDGVAIPGDADGRVWVYSRPMTKKGYEPVYSARGLARRGDIYVDIWIYSSSPIRTATILDVSKRQLERL